MTIWSAPDVAYLLEEQLQRASRELAGDSRLQKKVEDDGRGEDPGFVAELIVDKLEAAALAGFDAVEASLRASASGYLAGRGLSVLQVRSTLASAAERLVPPRRPRLEKVELSTIPPWVIAGMAGAGGLDAALSLCQFGLVSTLTGAVLALASLGLAIGVYQMLRYQSARHRAHLIDEWPARVSRHYSSALRDGTAYYEYVVRTVARGGTLIPWR